MKKNILSILFVCSIAFVSNAQIVDSVSISFKKYRVEAAVPWEFRKLQTDSFSSGQLKSTCIQKWNNSSWRLDSSYIYIYSSNVLNEVIFQSWNSTQWENAKRWLYFHTSFPDSTISQIWINGWINETLTVQYNNSIGLDSLRLNQKWINSQWENLKKVEKIYSADSSLMSATYSTQWNNATLQWQHVYRELSFHDSFGNDTAMITQFQGTSGWVNVFATYRIFLPNGLISEESDYEWMEDDSAFSVISEHTTYTYDSAFNLIEIYTNSIPGGFGDVLLTYDSFGNLVNLFEHYESMGGIGSDLNTEWFNSPYPDPEIHLFVEPDSIHHCTADTAQLNIFAFGGMSPLHFHWTPSTGLSSDTVESPRFFNLVPTEYFLSVSDDSLNSISDTVQITATPTPVFTNVQRTNTSCIGCSDGTFTVSVLFAPLNFLYVIPNNGAVIVNNEISNLTAGVYSICISTPFNCTTCITDSILDDPTKVSEINNSAIRFYPNPFSSHADLFIENVQSDLQLDLIDAFGRKVRTEKINSGNQRIERGSLANGTYVGVIRSDEKILARIKIVVM